MKSKATTAMADVLPVQTVIRARAFPTADRLAQNDLCTRHFETNHGSIRKVIANPIFDMPRDRMITNMDFVRHYEAILPSRSEWLDCLPEMARWFHGRS